MSSRSLVVVIEDQEEVRENLAETLELADYDVATAADGHTGVQLVRERTPQLILCDVMMPRLDGFGVLELLRADPATAGIPLVFLTARAEREDLRRGMNLGAADYITKPFFQDELLRVVQLRITEPPASSVEDATATTLERAGVAARAGAATGTDVRAILQELAAGGRQRTYAERAPIFFDGDRVHAVYRVARGRVRLYRETAFGKALTVDTAGTGTWFGIDGFLGGGVHAASAAAYPAAEVDVVDRSAFAEALRQHPELVGSFAAQLAQDLALRAEQLLQIAYFSVRKRVAEFLLRSTAQAAGGLVDLRREDIAEAVGTTSESVTRVLTEFRREGLVELPSTGGIRVADAAGLEGVPV